MYTIEIFTSLEGVVQLALTTIVTLASSWTIWERSFKLCEITTIKLDIYSCRCWWPWPAFVVTVMSDRSKQNQCFFVSSGQILFTFCIIVTHMDVITHSLSWLGLAGDNRHSSSPGKEPPLVSCRMTVMWNLDTLPNDTLNTHSYGFLQPWPILEVTVVKRGGKLYNIQFWMGISWVFLFLVKNEISGQGVENWVYVFCLFLFCVFCPCFELLFCF